MESSQITTRRRVTNSHKILSKAARSHVRNTAYLLPEKPLILTLHTVNISQLILYHNVFTVFSILYIFLT